MARGAGNFEKGFRVLGMDRFWQYVGECLRILYWASFKPFTFAKWLREEVHPDLRPISNHFELQAKFATNHQLRRYVRQVGDLSAYVPVAITIVVGLLYSIFSFETFNWGRSSSTLLGWITGLFLTRIISIKNIQRNVSYSKNIMRLITRGLLTRVLTIGLLLIVMTFLLIFLLNLSARMTEETFCMAIGLSSASVSALMILGLDSVIIGVTIGVASGFTGLAIALVLGLGFGVLLRLKSSEELSVFRSVASDIFLGLLFSCVVGIAMGWVFGLAVGWVFGLAFGVSWILGVLRIYFWVPQLIWMVILWFFASRNRLTSYLPLFPPNFDEATFLPLPFADKFLVAAYRQSPDRVRDTIEYLVASTKQQRLAASVMLQISADYLVRCQTLNDIVATTTALDWITNSPQVGDSLPTLLEIAQDVRSATESSSAYRQSEALNKPIQRLDRLKKTIALDRAAMPIFASISQKWLEILTTAQKNLRAAISNDAEIPEAYIAGSSLDPESAKDLFKGRSDLMREIERLSLASQPPVLLLYGGRRSGKTSLLKYLPKQLPSDIIPLAIDLQGSASSTTLYGVARFFAEETIRVAKNRNLKLPSIDLEDFDRDPFPALQRWMDRAEQSIKGKRFLWCLDEYERLSEVVAVTNSRAPLNFLRHTIQHRQQHWILLFSGFRTLEELEPYWSDYLINTQSLRVTYLHRTEAIELIQHPIPDFPDIYSPEAIERILFLTHCQPYLVQLICLCIVTYLNTENRRLATIADIEAVLPKAFELGTQYFREFWLESLSESDRNLLTQLFHNQQPNPSDRPILKKLCDREILFDDESQNYPFQIPLIGLYIQKAIGL